MKSILRILALFYLLIIIIFLYYAFLLNADKNTEFSTGIVTTPAVQYSFHNSTSKKNKKTIATTFHIANDNNNDAFKNISYNAKKTHESSKTIHSTQNFILPNSTNTISRKISESNVNTNYLTHALRFNLHLPNKTHFSERKPFEETQQANDINKQRAPFESNPPFPSDPGDMPLGSGTAIFILLSSIYIAIKKRMKLYQKIKQITITI